MKKGDEYQDIATIISHWQKEVDFKLVKEAGILGVIHKATEGETYQDPQYEQRRPEAEKRGLLCGAWHFGTKGDSGDAKNQVKNFLKAVGNDSKDIFLGVSFTHNYRVPSNTMLPEQLDDYCREHKEVTGRYPVIYTTKDKIQQIRPIAESLPNVLKCPLLITSWGEAEPTLADIKPWDKPLIWEYTDKGKVNGISGDCFRGKINCLEDEIEKYWVSGVIVHQVSSRFAASSR